MDGLDDVTTSILNAANIDEVLLHTLSRDDLRDLFPRPENFLRRKQLWAHVHKEDENLNIPDKIGPGATELKLGHASEALLHVLQPAEDPAIYLQRRSLFSPLLLFDGSRCLVAIGTTPITTFAKEELGQGLLYLMAYYYTLHLTYPKYVATLLSVIQTEELQDNIHERDTTTSYKKAVAEWKSFIEK